MTKIPNQTWYLWKWNKTNTTGEEEEQRRNTNPQVPRRLVHGNAPVRSVQRSRPPTRPPLWRPLRRRPHGRGGRRSGRSDPCWPRRPRRRVASRCLLCCSPWLSPPLHRVIFLMGAGTEKYGVRVRPPLKLGSCMILVFTVCAGESEIALLADGIGNRRRNAGICPLSQGPREIFPGRMLSPDTRGVGSG